MNIATSLPPIALSALRSVKSAEDVGQVNEQSPIQVLRDWAYAHGVQRLLEHAQSKNPRVARACGRRLNALVAELQELGRHIENHHAATQRSARAEAAP
jgi:hypothetical protein